MTEEENRIDPGVPDQEVPFFGVDKRLVEVTPAMVETWQAGVRTLFKEVVKLHGGDEAAAWASVASHIKGIAPDIGPDDNDWAYEIVTSKRDCTLEEGRRILERFRERTPLLDALAAALGE